MKVVYLVYMNMKLIIFQLIEVASLKNGYPILFDQLPKCLSQTEQNVYFVFIELIQEI